MKNLLVVFTFATLVFQPGFAHAKKKPVSKRASASVTAKKAEPAPAPAADEPINENPVTAQIKMDPDKVTPGGTAKIVINIDVAPEHHAYKDMIKVSWGTPEDGVTVDTVTVDPVKNWEDPHSKKMREVVEGPATVTAIAHFPATMAAGDRKGAVKFGYQACSVRYCLFPKTLSFDVAYSVAAAGTAVASNKPDDKSMTAATTDAGSGSGISGSFGKALARGKFWAFIFVFVGGFLTSLTPCVFPMIPITISIIGARAAQNQKSKAFALSLSYVLGIGITYAALGVLAASTGAFFGAALSNVYVVSVIAFVFMFMALSMLGFYELQVPASIRNKFGNANTGSGIPGAFLGGLFAGLVASPCIGPVLVSILTYVAQTAQVVFGFFLLFTFAMGMGILFIVLGTFSGLLTKMPKAGPWMEAIKFSFGIMFMAMAYFYVYPHLSQNVFYVAVALGLFFITSYYGAFAPSPATPREQLKKGMMLAGFVGGCLLLASVIIGQIGLKATVQVAGIPGAPGTAGAPGTEGSQQAANGALQWQPYADRVVASIAQSHRPVIVDFYADWCVACHELEKDTYTNSGVISKAKGFDLLKINATESTPEVEALKKKYGVVGLPTVIFIDGEGKVREDLTVTGFVPPEDFLQRMDKTKL